MVSKKVTILLVTVSLVLYGAWRYTVTSHIPIFTLCMVTVASWIGFRVQNMLEQVNTRLDELNRVHATEIYARVRAELSRDPRIQKVETLEHRLADIDRWWPSLVTHAEVSSDPRLQKIETLETKVHQLELTARRCLQNLAALEEKLHQLELAAHTTDLYLTATGVRAEVSRDPRIQKIETLEERVANIDRWWPNLVTAERVSVEISRDPRLQKIETFEKDLHQVEVTARRDLAALEKKLHQLELTARTTELYLTATEMSTRVRTEISRDPRIQKIETLEENLANIGRWWPSIIERVCAEISRDPRIHKVETLEEKLRQLELTARTTERFHHIPMKERLSTATLNINTDSITTPGSRFPREFILQCSRDRCSYQVTANELLVDKDAALYVIHDPGQPETNELVMMAIDTFGFPHVVAQLLTAGGACTSEEYRAPRIKSSEDNRVLSTRTEYGAPRIKSSNPGGRSCRHNYIFSYSAFDPPSTVPNTVNDYTLAGLSGVFPRLTGVTIKEAKGISTLDWLAGYTKLEEVIVEDCPNLINIQALQGMLSLKTISLKGCSAVATPLDVSSLPKLENLDVRGTGISKLPRADQVRMKNHVLNYVYV